MKRLNGVGTIDYFAFPDIYEGFLFFFSKSSSLFLTVKQTGQIKDGKMSGKGKYFMEDKVYISEKWEENVMKEGLVYLKEGGYYEGGFDNFEMSGRGVFHSDYGDIWECDWINGVARGEVKLTDASGHKMGISFFFSEIKFVEIHWIKKKEFVLDNEGEVEGELEEFKKKLNPSILKCYENNFCTRAFTRRNYYPQLIIGCLTCGIVDGFGICFSCSQTCHKEHEFSSPSFKKELAYFCDCSAKGNCNLFLMNKDYEPEFGNYTVSCPFYHELVPEKERDTKPFAK